MGMEQWWNGELLVVLLVLVCADWALECETVDLRADLYVRGLSGKYPAILNISRTGRMALV
jgi:hypothetical protein